MLPLTEYFASFSKSIRFAITILAWITRSNYRIFEWILELILMNSNDLFLPAQTSTCIGSFNKMLPSMSVVSVQRSQSVIWTVNKNSINGRFDVYWIRMLTSRRASVFGTGFMDSIKPQFCFHWFDLLGRKHLIGSQTKAMKSILYWVASTQKEHIKRFSSLKLNWTQWLACSWVCYCGVFYPARHFRLSH